MALWRKGLQKPKTSIPREFDFYAEQRVERIRRQNSYIKTNTSDLFAPEHKNYIRTSGGFYDDTITGKTQTEDITSPENVAVAYFDKDAYKNQIILGRSDGPRLVKKR